eukprot:CFRG2141T1
MVFPNIMSPAFTDEFMTISWSAIQTGKECLLVKLLHKHNSLCILVVNSSELSVWTEQLTDKEVETRASISNPGLHFTKEAFTKLLTNTITVPASNRDSNDNVKFSWSTNTMQNCPDKAEFKFEVMDIGNYKWHFNLARHTHGGQVVSHQLVLPMAAFMNVVANEQQILFDTIRMKEQEIKRMRALLGEADKRHTKNTLSAGFDHAISREKGQTKTEKEGGISRPLQTLLRPDSDFQKRNTHLGNCAVIGATSTLQCTGEQESVRISRSQNMDKLLDEGENTTMDDRKRKQKDMVQENLTSSPLKYEAVSPQLSNAANTRAQVQSHLRDQDHTPTPVRKKKRNLNRL